MLLIILLYCILILLMGWLVSVLINYLADVLPISRKLVPVVCPKCSSTSSVQDYLLLKPCKQCGNNKNARNIIITAVIPASYIYLFLFTTNRFVIFHSSIILAYLILVSVIDIEYRAILYIEVLAGVGIGIVSGYVSHGWFSTIIGGLVGFIVMYLLFLLGKLFSIVFMKNKSMVVDDVALGFGDVNLGGVIGLFLGWPGITAGLLLAIIFGGIVSLGIIIFARMKRNYTPYAAIPYAPFLVLSTIILLFRPG